MQKSSILGGIDPLTTSIVTGVSSSDHSASESLILFYIK
jgi:hypothetical protein